MIIFINDIPVRILKEGKNPDPDSYTMEINADLESITKAKLINHVLIHQATLQDMDHVMALINSKIPIQLLSLQIILHDFDLFKKNLNKNFKRVEAAGGLIQKKDRFLMMYRMKRWDLPKGKIEEKESYRKAAVREVEEECNVKVRIGKKICTTWHTYTMNRRSMIKKTKWYQMTLVDDSKMKPCIEEDIEELRWMRQKEVYHALENSYRSIQYVFEKFYKQKEAPK